MTVYNSIKAKGVVPMGIIKNRKLKGFTLIEMIIVIAILGILISIASWSVSGFLRVSRMRANQGSAELGLGAIQNCLVNWEINPGLAGRTFDGISSNPLTNEFSKFGLNCVLLFNLQNGRIVGNIGVIINNGTSSIQIGPAFMSDQYERLREQIEKSFGPAHTGRYDVYFNGPAAGTRAYTSFRSVYSPETNGVAINSNMTNLLRVSLNAANGTQLYANYNAHLFDYRTNNDKYGVFPYVNDVP